MIVKEQRFLHVDKLVPETFYTFNMSALFIDGSWGPVVMLSLDTLPQGMSHLEIVVDGRMPFHRTINDASVDGVCLSCVFSVNQMLYQRFRLLSAFSL